MAGQFYELSGVLGPHTGLDAAALEGSHSAGRVVLSNLSRGSREFHPNPCASLKYVAAGTEIYRFGNQTYPVTAGNFLYVPELREGDVEIGRSEAATTVGLCIYLPARPGLEGTVAPGTPMIFPAACSDLGRLLSRTLTRMIWSKDQRAAIASHVLRQVRTEVEPLFEETIRILEGMDALKPSTRYESFRRLNLARGFLHSVTDRPVELGELAKLAGISRFQLLRSFRDAFGAPPAAYHRTLRLKLAKEEIDGKRLSCSEAAHRFGFADCSSFSHAYRRAFGEAPVRSLGKAA